ncbi:MAG TPA: SUF system NifU family Fe-S cluster assembly protein [Anaerolineae bacterium]|nr:SUF system NifU family Fe-S cluster assembly protein [Anaerolineae bacterium]
MDDLYRELIIDHYKNPLHRGELAEHDFSFEDENPLCGDFIHIDLKVDEDDKVVAAAFNGQGCAISQASSDLLLDFIIGKSVEEIKALNKKDMMDLLGIELSAVRLKCALLPLKIVKAAVYRLQQASDDLVT